MTADLQERQTEAPAEEALSIDQQLDGLADDIIEMVGTPMSWAPWRR